MGHAPAPRHRCYYLGALTELRSAMAKRRDEPQILICGLPGPGAPTTAPPSQSTLRSRYGDLQGFRGSTGSAGSGGGGNRTRVSFRSLQPTCGAVLIIV